MPAVVTGSISMPKISVAEKLVRFAREIAERSDSVLTGCADMRMKVIGVPSPEPTDLSVASRPFGDLWFDEIEQAFDQIGSNLTEIAEIASKVEAEFTRQSRPVSCPVS